jgi:hypothetical protein
MARFHRGGAPPETEAAQQPPPRGARPRASASSSNSDEISPVTPYVYRDGMTGNIRRQRHVERLCGTPRLVAELLGEIGRHHCIADDIDRRLARYAGMDPAVLAALGGDRFPPRLWAVSRDAS